MLDGTSWYWYDYHVAHDMAFYEDHMYVRATNRQMWERSILPYLSFVNLGGSITYINFFADIIMPTFTWGKCDMEEGVGSYNAIGMFLYIIPLFGHNTPYTLTSTGWLEPKTAGVKDSFPSPEGSPESLAWDGEYLWVAYETDYDSMIYRYDVSRDAPASPKHTPASEQTLSVFPQLLTTKDLVDTK